MHRCWIEVSRGQIARNFQSVERATGPDIEVMPVVKADAYRHGMCEVAKVLAGCGARWMGVSNVGEGVTLRQAGIDARLLVMADFLPSERDYLFEYKLTPALHSLEDIAGYDGLAKKRGIIAPFHLKIDSGMGRLGTTAAAQEILLALSASPNAHLEGLMTHFASAGNYISNQTEEQIARFADLTTSLVASGVRPKYTHLSSTIGIAYNRREAWGNLVRPGHAIYGYVSPARGEAPERILQVQPALTWKTRVLTVKHLPKGAQIGYGGMFRSPKQMKIAVLAAGYADGIPHGLGNKGKVMLHGQFCNIIGAVSMDLTTIDVTHLENVEAGEVVTLLGRDGPVSIDAQQMARMAGEISYSLLCGISARVERIYVD